MVGSPLLWLLPLLLFYSRFLSEGQLANGTGYRKKKKIDKLAGEAPCVYCAIQVRRAAGAEWLLLVFIGAY